MATEYRCKAGRFYAHASVNGKTRRRMDSRPPGAHLVVSDRPGPLVLFEVLMGQRGPGPSPVRVPPLMAWRRGGSKYGNVPQRCRQNVMHQSKLETKRCNELQLMQEGGLIENLEAHPQPRFRLDVNGHHICDYMADFRYYDTQLRREVVEDVKGRATEVYKLKKRLMLACHGIEVEEVKR